MYAIMINSMVYAHSFTLQTLELPTVNDPFSG